MKNDSIAFTDLLFNLLLGYAFLFVISFLLIQPIIKKAEVSTQAEFVITVTWPLDNADDVDTWISDPLGNMVWFKQKERGLMHLDRDDLGNENDVIYLEDGTAVKYPYNQELLTIRGFIPGEWVLNVHMYNKRTEKPTPVHVVLDKLNPTIKTLASKTVDLAEKWDEVTVVRFNMSANGDILDMNDLPKSLVQGGPNV